MPVGLGNDTDTIALAFQYAADEGCGKTGVIDIGVAIDVDKIEADPSRGVPCPLDWLLRISRAYGSLFKLKSK